MTKLIDKKAPRGKFRVIADNFGQWRTKHSDILVGDFDPIDQARTRAQPARSRPWFEHWSVIICDDKGFIVGPKTDKAALLAPLREEFAFVEFRDDLDGLGARGSH